MHGPYFVTSQSLYDVGRERSARRSSNTPWIGEHKSYSSFRMYSGYHVPYIKKVVESLVQSIAVNVRFSFTLFVRSPWNSSLLLKVMVLKLTKPYLNASIQNFFSARIITTQSII